MRRRLVAAFVGLTAVVLLLYGAPRAVLITNLITSQEQHVVDRSADLLALIVGEQVRAGTPVTAAGLAPALEAGDRVTYATPDGDRIEAGDPGTGSDAITATRVVPGGGELTLLASTEGLRAQLREMVLPILLTGLLLLGFAALAGWWLADRLAKPFQALALSARQLGAGHLGTTVPHSNVPEAEAIGQALRTGSRQFAANLEHERHFADTASHELRTPLTALRLDLEDLTHWPETSPAVAEQLRQSLGTIDRLTRVIRSQLDRSRRHRMDVARDFDLAAVVADAVAGWCPRLIGTGRELVLVGGEPVPVRLPLAAVVQAVDALIGHVLDDRPDAAAEQPAAEHPAAKRPAASRSATATRPPQVIQVRTLDLGSHARVELTGLPPSPEGSPTPSPALGRARELASFVGGQLVGGGADDAQVGLLLPTIEPEL